MKHCFSNQCPKLSEQGFFISSPYRLCYLHLGWYVFRACRKTELIFIIFEVLIVLWDFLSHNTCSKNEIHVEGMEVVNWLSERMLEMQV